MRLCGRIRERAAVSDETKSHQDGSYSQPAKSGQPLTITNNAGKVTHLRYDARGNVTSMWDALGNTTDITYNLADDAIDVRLLATALRPILRCLIVTHAMRRGVPL